MEDGCEGSTTIVVPKKSSVRELRQWLSNFGEQNMDHYRKGQHFATKTSNQTVGDSPSVPNNGHYVDVGVAIDNRHCHPHTVLRSSRDADSIVATSTTSTSDGSEYESAESGGAHQDGHRPFPPSPPPPPPKAVVLPSPRESIQLDSQCAAALVTRKAETTISSSSTAFENGKEAATGCGCRTNEDKLHGKKALTPEKNMMGDDGYRAVSARGPMGQHPHERNGRSPRQQSLSSWDVFTEFSDPWIGNSQQKNGRPPRVVPTPSVISSLGNAEVERIHRSPPRKLIQGEEESGVKRSSWSTSRGIIGAAAHGEADGFGSSRRQNGLRTISSAVRTDGEGFSAVRTGEPERPNRSVSAPRQQQQQQQGEKYFSTARTGEQNGPNRSASARRQQQQQHHEDFHPHRRRPSLLAEGAGMIAAKGWYDELLAREEERDDDNVNFAPAYFSDSGGRRQSMSTHGPDGRQQDNGLHPAVGPDDRPKHVRKGPYSARAASEWAPRGKTANRRESESRSTTQSKEREPSPSPLRSKSREPSPSPLSSPKRTTMAAAATTTTHDAASTNNGTTTISSRLAELEKKWAANRPPKHVRKVKWQACRKSGLYKKKVTIDVVD